MYNTNENKLNIMDVFCYEETPTLIDMMGDIHIAENAEKSSLYNKVCGTDYRPFVYVLPEPAGHNDCSGLLSDIIDEMVGMLPDLGINIELDVLPGESQ
jgi:hypothetical protein